MMLKKAFSSSCNKQHHTVSNLVIKICLWGNILTLYIIYLIGQSSSLDLSPLPKEYFTAAVAMGLIFITAQMLSVLVMDKGKVLAAYIIGTIFSFLTMGLGFGAAFLFGLYVHHCENLYTEHQTDIFSHEKVQYTSQGVFIRNLRYAGCVSLFLSFLFFQIFFFPALIFFLLAYKQRKETLVEIYDNGFSLIPKPFHPKVYLALSNIKKIEIDMNKELHIYLKKGKENKIISNFFPLLLDPQDRFIDNIEHFLKQSEVPFVKR